MSNTKYQIKRYSADPFDIMCGDCPVHEIEWWEDSTPEDLRNAHSEELEMDAATPDWMVEEMQNMGEWNPANPDFDKWLKQRIEDGHIRTAYASNEHSYVYDGDEIIIEVPEEAAARA